MATTDFITEGDGFVDVALSRPLEIAGAKVATIRLREPTVADQLATDTGKGTDAQREIALIANLAELAPDDLKRLPMKDYKRLQLALLGFID